MDFRRLFDILHYQQSKYPGKKVLAGKQNHQWKYYSTADCIREMESVSAGLLDLGLKKGDKVAIISHNGSPTWNLLDMGLLQIGVVVVPIHATISKEHLEYILREAKIKYVFASNKEMYAKIQDVINSSLVVKKVFTFEKHQDIPSYKDLLIVPNENHQATFQTYRAAIHEDDLATIIYTSGTTGMPKGVMLSHKNIVSNIKAIISLIPINYSKRTISFLPLSHIFERMTTYTYMAVGASLHYAESMETVLENIKEVRPHYFSSVPRLLEKMYDRILEEGNKRNFISRKILSWAINLGEQFQENQRNSLFYKIQLFFARILVFGQWKRALGGRVDGIVVGAAALQEKLARLFSATGIKVREGYGLTESSPVVSFNRFNPGLYSFGTVGVPIPGLEVKIRQFENSEEGEIMVKGPGVMMGYFEKPEATAEVLTKDGWLHTGDVGKFVHKRFLQITDRKKDIFKTSSGKYVAPQRLENLLKSSDLIEQCLIIGFQKPFVSALIVPSFPALEKWCKKNDIHWTAPKYMIHNPLVEAHFSKLIDNFNQNLARHEKIRKHLLLEEEWTLENGEITPTLKIVRHAILDKFSKDILKLYS